MNANIILDSDDENNQVGQDELNKGNNGDAQVNKNGLNDIPDDIAQILEQQDIKQEEFQPRQYQDDDEEKQNTYRQQRALKSEKRTSRPKSSKKSTQSPQKTQQQRKSQSKKLPKKTTYFDYSESQHEIDPLQRKKEIMEQRAALQGQKFKNITKHSNLIQRSQDDDDNHESHPTNIIGQTTDWKLYQVDKESKLQSTCHVYEDYSATLNLTDVGYGQKGHNKFYIIQLLQANNFNKWYCYCKWGRVGATTPSDQLMQFKMKMDAIKCFTKKFKSKTHNQWSNRKTHFKQVVGKYRLVEVQSTQIEALKKVKQKHRLRQLIQKSAKNFRPKCEKSIGILMEMIFQEKRMEKTLQEQNIDIKKCPLGLLGRKQISQGYRALKKIMSVLVKKKQRSGGQFLRILIPLSNQFYTIIPHDFGFDRPPPITMLANVKNKISLLDTLLDIQLARQHLMKNLEFLQTCHPHDFYYKTLNARIVQISPSCEVYETIERAIKTTSCHGYQIEIQKIFSYIRFEQLIRFMPFMLTKQTDNYLLWHGSRLSNIAGILTQGLRVAPQQAPRTGYMFGKGIYFADIASKAANYCHTEKEENQEGILILSEVGLGKCYKAYKNEYLMKAPDGYLSVKGVGREAPQNIEVIQNNDSEVVDKILELTKNQDDDEASDQRVEMMRQFLEGDCQLGKKLNKIFIGKVQENVQDLQQETELNYNEYVVYEEAQTRIRYIIQWRRRKND